MVGLVGAGLFTRSFQNARALNPGFDPKNVVVWRSYLAAEASEQQQTQIFEGLRQRLAQLPGVTATSFADIIPLGFGLGPTRDLTIDGYTPAPAEDMSLPTRDGVARIFCDVANAGFSLQDRNVHLAISRQPARFSRRAEVATFNSGDFRAGQGKPVGNGASLGRANCSGKL